METQTFSQEVHLKGSYKQLGAVSQNNHVSDIYAKWGVMLWHPNDTHDPSSVPLYFSVLLGLGVQEALLRKTFKSDGKGTERL